MHDLCEGHKSFQLLKISLVTSLVRSSMKCPAYWQFVVSELFKLNTAAVHSKKGSNHLAEHEKRGCVSTTLNHILSLLLFSFILGFGRLNSSSGL